MLKYFTFLSQYGRSHASKEQFDHRFSIFNENIVKIDAHNAGDVPFELGVNEFTDWTEEEFLQAHTTKLVPSRLRRIKHLQTSVDSSDSSTSWHPDYNLDDYFWPENVPLPESKNWFAEGKVTVPQS